MAAVLRHADGWMELESMMLTERGMIVFYIIPFI